MEGREARHSCLGWLWWAPLWWKSNWSNLETKLKIWGLN